MKILYKSGKMGRNLWQRYTIFKNCLELRCWFFTMRIKLNEIKKIEIKNSVASVDMLRGKSPLTTVKLDLSDLYRHISIKRKTGFWKELRFTPDNVDKFYKILGKRCYGRENTGG